MIYDRLAYYDADLNVIPWQRNRGSGSTSELDLTLRRA